MTTYLMNYTCACCGFQTHDEPPGSDEICPICFWQDDAVQLLDPWFSGGANKPNLADAQTTFARRGAVEERLLTHVRKPCVSDSRDPTWRPVGDADRARVRTPASLTKAEYSDRSLWYYWRRKSPDTGRA